LKHFKHRLFSAAGCHTGPRKLKYKKVRQTAENCHIRLMGSGAL
jgi:hypothetical protein